MLLTKFEDIITDSTSLVIFAVMLGQPILNLGGADILERFQPLQNDFLPLVQAAAPLPLLHRLVILDGHVPILVNSPPVQPKMPGGGVLAETLLLFLLDL